jgi:hypothetical protein
MRPSGISKYFSGHFDGLDHASADELSSFVSSAASSSSSSDSSSAFSSATIKRYTLSQVRNAAAKKLFGSFPTPMAFHEIASHFHVASYSRDSQGKRKIQ